MFFEVLPLVLWHLVNAFLWLLILILCRHSLDFWYIRLLSRGFAFRLEPVAPSSSVSLTEVVEVGFSQSREWVTLLGAPFREDLSQDCGSSCSSFSGFLLPSWFSSQALVSGIEGFFVVVEKFLSSTVQSAQFWKLLLGLLGCCCTWFLVVNSRWGFFS